MALRDEMAPYFDGNGLIAPNPVPAGVQKGSDNGPMYLSEYYVMLQKSGQLLPQDYTDFDRIINGCINLQGMLCRVPVPQDDGQEGPDDYIGTLNACKQLGNTEIPRKFLKAVIKYNGGLNNENPGTWTEQSFLVRQIQLLAAMVAASFPSWKNPLHVLIRWLCWPLFFYAGVSIAISCMNVPTTDTDSRRLSWHLMQATRGSSIFCWLASKIWLKRLYKDYGPTGMSAVASIYYSPNLGNPFSKYWITD